MATGQSRCHHTSFGSLHHDTSFACVGREFPQLGSDFSRQGYPHMWVFSCVYGCGIHSLEDSAWFSHLQQLPVGWVGFGISIQSVADVFERRMVFREAICYDAKDQAVHVTHKNQTFCAWRYNCQDICSPKTQYVIYLEHFHTHK